jgi:predicted amidophosphoribosyltransferase
MSLTAALRSAASDLFTGAHCVGCAERGHTLCSACAGGLAGAPFRADPAPRPRGLPDVWAAAPYDRVARAALIAHKEEAVLALTRALGRALASSVAACLVSAADAGLDVAGAVVVPAPSRRAAVRTRGHDPVLRMARAAAARLRAVGLETRVAPVLRLDRSVLDQASLGRAQRRANLHGAVGVRTSRTTRLSRGRQRLSVAVIVDDIVTTGATLHECARALAGAGVWVLGAAVVAATPRHSTASPAAAREGAGG